MSYASEQSVLNTQWNAAATAIMAEEERMRPFMLLRPRLFPEGNQWCALYGDNVQEGVAGFGDTPEAAAKDFDKNWREQTLSRPQERGAEKPVASRAIPECFHRLVHEVRWLTEESRGVAGLHRNGDEAPWDELLPGGQFEHLTSLHECESMIAVPADQSAPAAGESEGKPSWKNAPPDANWRAQDADGEWAWHVLRPIPGRSSWMSRYPGKGHRTLVINPDPVPNPNWRNTLEQRPAQEDSQ